MGHLLGFNSQVPSFQSHVAYTIEGSQLFVAPDFTARLSSDGDHLEGAAYPADLMSATLAASVRELPSDLDARILRVVRGLAAPATLPFTLQPGQSPWAHLPVLSQPAARVSVPLLAANTTVPLEGISNGSFDVIDPTAANFGWTTRGGVTFAGNVASLTEQGRTNSRLT